jgi:DNA polymerase III delta prime subunit
MTEHLLWVEKYRPHKIEDCILPETLKETFQEYVNRKEIPNLLFTGSAGVGKTTIAKALCDEVGCDYLVINGSDNNGIELVRVTIKNYASSMSMVGGRKVIIIDEADYLTHNAQAAFRNAMEEFAENCSFIFTCNFKNKIMDALHSRCSVVDFKIPSAQKAKMATQFFKRVEYILNTEEVTYDKSVVAAVITKHFPDNRRILNELQRYSNNDQKTIDAGILAQVSDITLAPLVKAIKEKDFTTARKWVSSNLDNDSTAIIRKIYDSLYDFLKPESIPAAVLVLSKYQFQAAFVSDPEINLVACLTEFMIECDFK